MRLGAVLLATVLVGCGSDTAAPTPPTSSPASTEDADKATCQRFYELAGEIDLLTPEEGRAALKQMWEHAQDADNEALRSAARDMLEYFTNVNGPRLKDATNRMTDICAQVAFG